MYYLYDILFQFLLKYDYTNFTTLIAKTSFEKTLHSAASEGKTTVPRTLRSKRSERSFYGLLQNTVPKMLIPNSSLNKFPAWGGAKNIKSTFKLVNMYRRALHVISLGGQWSGSNAKLGRRDPLTDARAPPQLLPISFGSKDSAAEILYSKNC